MASIVRFQQIGSPQVLALEEVAESSPGPGEVWLEQSAVGVNYLDITQRNGAVAVALPSGLGLEAAGRVVALGAEVETFGVGDRVAYAGGPLGAYASGRIYPADRLLKLPEEVSEEEAAAVLFKGLTAQYLLKSTYPVGPGTVVLLYGVGGALGQLMATWAKHLGAFVIGVVSKQASVEGAEQLGCDAVLVFDREKLAGEVARLTQGQKANVVYDPVGRISWEASLDSLRPRGLMVSFGASSGAPSAVELATLNAKGSLFLTRPSLAAHTSSLAEYRERAADVWEAVAIGAIRPNVWGRYRLSEAALAHQEVESGRSAGSVLLKP
ncbi:quinone oxidoreductase [bacterium SCN 62-11]|mgnify:CR=1 FL=1|nr:quinone oxidoreductase [Candidatus Eremiobacteraeota bacterium]ODT56291.1 MAG: quinone oxidoreductase [bacterium SCN 62-11]